jgi:excinuclease ABC subunit C
MRYIVLVLHFTGRKRSKGAFKTQLDDIKGISKEAIGVLMKEFRSVNNIRNASVEEIAKVIGESRANLIKQALEKTEE